MLGIAECNIDNVEVRLVKGNLVMFQRLDLRDPDARRLLIVISAASDGEHCFELWLRYYDAVTRSEIGMYLGGTRYPCHCRYMENLVACMNYGECCEYVER